MEQCQVMTFNVSNHPITSESLMGRLLHGMALSNCLLYLADMLIHAKNFEQKLIDLQMNYNTLKFPSREPNTKAC